MLQPAGYPYEEGYLFPWSLGEMLSMPANACSPLLPCPGTSLPPRGQGKGEKGSASGPGSQ